MKAASVILYFFVLTPLTVMAQNQEAPSAAPPSQSTPAASPAQQRHPRLPKLSRRRPQLPRRSTAFAIEEVIKKAIYPISVPRNSKPFWSSKDS
jgi:hypothetical protein